MNNNEKESNPAQILWEDFRAKAMASSWEKLTEDERSAMYTGFMGGVTAAFREASGLLKDSADESDSIPALLRTLGGYFAGMVVCTGAALFGNGHPTVQKMMGELEEKFPEVIGE